MLEGGKDDPPIRRLEHIGSGENTFRDVNNNILDSNPKTIPPTKATSIRTQKVNISDELARSIHRKRQPPRWTQDFQL